MSEEQVLYKINPHGAYALYLTPKGWKESASVRNEELDFD